MRTCEGYELLISEFIDGALDEADRTELMAHMAGCPVCQAYFDDQIAIHDALTQLEEIPAPAGLAGQVMARVRETPQPSPAEKKIIPLPHWRRWAALAACCALIAVGVFGFQNNEPPASQAALRSAVMERALPADGERAAEEPAAAPVEDGIALHMGDDAPAAMPTEAALKQEKMLDSQMYAGTLSTASPVAGTWVAEQLGLVWESGGSYILTEAEYMALREEPFDEIPGEVGGSSYLLLAE